MSTGGPPPGEEELRAYEEQLSRISIPDMMAQAAVTLLNLAARQLPQGPGGPPGAPGDLEQARDAIDAAAALLAILERRLPQEVRPLRDALSQLQMGYAAAVRAGAGEGEAQAGEGGAAASEPPSAAPEEGSQGAPGGEQGDHRPGPAESSGRLWVPGS